MTAKVDMSLEDIIKANKIKPGSRRGGGTRGTRGGGRGRGGGLRRGGAVGGGGQTRGRASGGGGRPFVGNRAGFGQRVSTSPAGLGPRELRSSGTKVSCYFVRERKLGWDVSTTEVRSLLRMQLGQGMALMSYSGNPPLGHRDRLV